MIRSPALLLLCAFAACAPSRVVQGRPYELTVPQEADGATPLPLVVLLHGFSVNGRLEELVLPFRALVEEKRFLYAVPNGTPDRLNRRFWNATDACCQPDDMEVDDVAFLRAVIEDVKTQHPVDPARVFLVGHSTGGFMALRMACEAGDVVTGVMSLAGAAWSDFSRCPAGPPVSVLLLHGTSDKTIKYGDGSNSYGVYPGAQETKIWFATRNGCSVQAPAAEPLDVEEVAGAETRREAFTDCPTGGAIEHWSMEGVGHIPSFNEDLPARVFEWLNEHAR